MPNRIALAVLFIALCATYAPGADFHKAPSDRAGQAAARVEWVDPGNGTVRTPVGLQRPGAAVAGLTPQPSLPPATGAEDDLNYVYIDPAFSGANVFPWYPYSTGFRFQMLYMASEIGRSGSICQLALWKTYSTDQGRFPNVSVKLCHTNVSSLSTAFSDNYGGNVPVWVYHAANLIRGTGTAGAWDTIDLQRKFAYNGTSNLLVEVTWLGSASGSSPACWYSNDFLSRYRRVYAANTTDTLTPYGSRDAEYYNTRIGFCGVANDVGVSNIIWKSSGGCLAFGDTIWLRAEVTNYGTRAQTGVPVRCLIRDSVSGTMVYNQVVCVDLAVGAVDTVDFPVPFTPPAIEAVYMDTMRTENPGDQNAANDAAVAIHRVTEWCSRCLTYNDGVFEDTFSWQEPGNEIAEKFAVPMSAVAITKAVVWLTSSTGADYDAEVRLYGDDGGSGMPGTMLDAWVGKLHTSVWPSFYRNEVYFDPAVVVSYDSFFVSYYQTNITPNYPCVGMDYTAPVTIGNDWGRHDGVWGVSPSDAGMDFGIEACYEARLLDASCIDITVPPPVIDMNTTFDPEVVVKNVGLKNVNNIPVEFLLARAEDPGDVICRLRANSGPVAANGEVTVTFAGADLKPAPGYYVMTGISELTYDMEPHNDTFSTPLLVRYLDVGAELVSPHECEAAGAVPVEVRLTNLGNVPVMLPRLDVTIEPGGYAAYAQNIPLAVGQVMVVTLSPWVSPGAGRYTATACITYPDDMNHPNDTDVVVVHGSGAPGWTEMAPVPLGPQKRAIKDGAWLAARPWDDHVYAIKGDRTDEFYRYDIDGDSWHLLAPIREGRERKLPYAGARGVRDDSVYIYATKGDETPGFWRYDIEHDAWAQLADVPEKPNGNTKVEAGTDVTYVPRDPGWCTPQRDSGRGYVYLLKAYSGEFYRFNVTTGLWEERMHAPPQSGNTLWKSGSFITYDGEQTIYAQRSFDRPKGGVGNEIWTFDLVTQEWSANPLPGVPGEPGTASQDGGCGDWSIGSVWTLKGGDTREFWRYTPPMDWQALEPMPGQGCNKQPRNVFWGADIISHACRTFFAFKGHDTPEFWRFVYSPEASGGGKAGDISQGGEVGMKLALSPSLVTGNVLHIEYGLLRAGPATVTLVDVAGRAVGQGNLIGARTGDLSLDLRFLSAGVYLVRLDDGRSAVTRKLVVQR